MERITAEEVMDKLNMFQCRFGKIDEFGWWDLEIISSDAGKQLTSTEYKEECQTRGVFLMLVDLEHREMNGQVKVTWITLRTISHSLMVHARFLEACIHFALMYTTDHIFPVLPIKDLINEDGKPTMPFKLSTGTKPSVSHLRVLFFPCVVQKATSHFNKKALNMRHQSQRVFAVSLLDFHSIQKGILCKNRVQGR